MGKWTKGPWRLHLVDDTIIIDGNGRVVASVCAGDEENNWYDYNNPNDWPLMEANAALIAEAGTVAHETGLTPRQLADQRENLLAALKEARTDLMIAANNADHAAKTDHRWEGVGNTLRSRVEKCDDAIANAERKPRARPNTATC